jgi:tubulin monoglycylase TTLL15
VQNPLLVDGRAFDFGVYVLISSIEPLRIYRWKGDIMLRFFSELYHPFDAKNISKFVAMEDFYHYWEIPSLEGTEKLEFSCQDALDHILLKQGADLSKIWKEIDDAIVSLTLTKVAQISRYVKLFQRVRSTRRGGLFELLRFDFILDDQMKLFLMEINMSPDMEAVKARENVTFEQLVHDTITLMGGARRLNLEPVCVGNTVQCPGSSEDNRAESEMLSAAKDVAVNLNDCINCNESCDHEACALCLSCLPRSTLLDFLQSHREHHRRGRMKRLFPTKMYSQEKIMKRLSEPDRLSVKWFKAKCESDADWC